MMFNSMRQLAVCLCDCVDGTLCRFHVPHINVGDLLYAEVAAKTPLGLEAQRHMDSSKTVPDRLLMKLLLERLQHADCQAQGWVLDGFPHTRKQVRHLGREQFALARLRQLSLPSVETATCSVKQAS
jgi:adenylate kinase